MYQHGVGMDSPDYKQALVWFKMGAEGGDTDCQYQLGWMYQHGVGMDSPDYKRALAWFEKAAAQNHPNAVCQLGFMAHESLGQTPSWRRAREHYQRAIDLGNKHGPGNMETLERNIQKVGRSHRRPCPPRPPPPPPPTRPSSPHS